MKKLILPCLALLISSCFYGNLTGAEVCKSSTVIFSPISPDGNLLISQGSIEIDFSSLYQELEDLGSVTMSISRDQLVSITGNLNWIHHMKVTIQGAVNTAGYPSVVLADQDISNPGQQVNLSSQLDNVTFTSYMSQGAVTLIFNATGTEDSGSIIQNFCSVDSIHVHEGL